MGLLTGGNGRGVDGRWRKCVDGCGKGGRGCMKEVSHRGMWLKGI